MSGHSIGMVPVTCTACHFVVVKDPNITHTHTPKQNSQRHMLAL